MSVISSFGALSESNRLGFNGIVRSSSSPKVLFTPFQNDRFHRPRFTFVHSKKTARRTTICMTLVDKRIARGRDVISPSDILAYDLVQGADVRWSYIMANSVPEPPTAVLLHGILGSRKNWGTFARRLVKEFPKWQFLLVDLRCHGDSAAIEKQGPHNVPSAALDILNLLGRLRLRPRVIVGHSFGGKVALSMVDQAAKPLARPVRVWVLDATPGKVRAGGDGEDHPGELISFLKTLPKEVASKRGVLDALVREGFSKDVAQWVVTNLRQTDTLGSSTSSFSWGFDLNGISEMYQSYEETNLWKIVENVPRGVHVNFLKAERSLHRWALEDLQRIHCAEEVAVEGGGGVEMHVLEDAGHWNTCIKRRANLMLPFEIIGFLKDAFHASIVPLGCNQLSANDMHINYRVHADNPDGLFKILSFSFQGV